MKMQFGFSSHAFRVVEIYIDLHHDANEGESHIDSRGLSTNREKCRRMLHYKKGNLLAKSKVIVRLTGSSADQCCFVFLDLDDHLLDAIRENTPTDNVKGAKKYI